MVSSINGINGGSYSNYNVNNISTGNSKLDELIKSLVSQGYSLSEAKAIAEAELEAEAAEGTSETEETTSQGVSSYGVSSAYSSTGSEGIGISSLPTDSAGMVGQMQVADLNKYFMLGM